MNIIRLFYNNNPTMNLANSNSTYFHRKYSYNCNSTKKVKDTDLIGSMSGHVEGSQATAIPIMGMSGILVLALANVLFRLLLAVEVLPQILFPDHIHCDSSAVLHDCSSGK